MSILGGAGKEAGTEAVHEAHVALDEALATVTNAVIPAAQKAADEVAVQVAGSIERAAGQFAATMAYLPEQIMMALDGMTVEVSAITVKVTRKQST